MAVPIWLVAGQAAVSLYAAASWQRSAIEILPTRPGGSSVLTELTYCSPSLRARLNVKFVLAPALPLLFWVDWAGLNGGGLELQPVIVSPNGSVLRLPGADVGSNTATPFASPHSSGFATGARTLRLKLIARLVNGCSGGLLNVVVTCPVARSGLTCATRRTETPYLAEFATTYIVNGGLVIGPDSGPPR